MKIVVVAVDIAAVTNVAFETVHSQVETAQASSVVGLLDTVDGELG